MSSRSCKALQMVLLFEPQQRRALLVLLGAIVPAMVSQMAHLVAQR